MHLHVHESTGRYSVWPTLPPLRNGYLVIEPDAAMIAKLKLGKPLRWQPVEGSSVGELVEIPHAAAVPISIKAWQAKAVLAATPHPDGGTMLAAAEAAIAAMPEGMEKIAIQSAWANNADFSRTAPTIVALAATLGINDARLNAMFIAAAALTV